MLPSRRKIPLRHSDQRLVKPDRRTEELLERDLFPLLERIKRRQRPHVVLTELFTALRGLLGGLGDNHRDILRELRQSLLQQPVGNLSLLEPIGRAVLADHISGEEENLSPPQGSVGHFVLMQHRGEVASGTGPLGGRLFVFGVIFDRQIGARLDRTQIRLHQELRLFGEKELIDHRGPKIQRRLNSADTGDSSQTLGQLIIRNGQNRRVHILLAVEDRLENPHPLRKLERSGGNQCLDRGKIFRLQGQGGLL